MICLIDAGILVLGGAIGNLMLQILVGQFSGGNSRLCRFLRFHPITPLPAMRTTIQDYAKERSGT
jgi:hypothetical protein